MEDRVIWQPLSIYQPGFSFDILLDTEFAKETFDLKLSRKNRESVQQLPGRLMNFEKPEPYIFHKDTYFITQINLNAGDGKWLSLDKALMGRDPDFDDPIKYSTHNFDYRTTSADVLVLMGLFDMWVEYFETMKNIVESER